MATAHPWWRHVPPAERAGRRAELLGARILSLLRRRRSRIVACLLFYALLCLIPLAIAQPHLTLLALMPLAVVPPVAYLAYWIAWHEFHR
jgi:hypothetical protein